MKISILTDNPVLYGNSMYLSQLEMGLKSRKAWADVFVIRPSTGILESRISLKRTIQAVALKRELEKYDVIHVQFTFPIGLVCSLLRKLGLLSSAIIIHTHGYDVLTVPEVGYGLRRTALGCFAAKQAWNNASKTITVCRETARRVAIAGVASDKIEILYNGVDHQLFRKCNKSGNRKIEGHEPFVFLNVASFLPIKNHIALLAAFRKIRRLYKDKFEVKLVLVGDGPLRNLIESKAPEGVVFCGKIPHNKLPSVYCQSDAFILPSKSEGHPWSLLEAMSCGIPSIASSVGGVPETIQNPEFLINPWSIEDIMMKMVSLVEMSQEERASLGDRNREIVLREFTMDDHIDNLLRIYEDALGIKIA
ncbi:MAG: glycosyltransferase [Candidatus Bathyarchaeota archaeon]|nr:glycosyltransferase [Candidatus Bathyarchaeota archaeon]